MKLTSALWSYLSSTSVLALGNEESCKSTPGSKSWPSDQDWSVLNKTLEGALIRGVPPGSVCYPSQPNYNQDACNFVLSQWTNSTWHATDPVSIDYPIWTNNSCNPIFPNGTSLSGDTGAGARGCSVGSYPAHVVKATKVTQIAAALKWAGDKNIRVIVKSTGHSYPGRSVGYGSLSIWTHYLRGIEVIKDFKPMVCPLKDKLSAVSVAAGHTGAEVARELSKYNMATVTGANPDVGIVGWLTGGGHGFLSRSYGLGADNLYEATIVTPDGNILTANPCQNSDIFSAIRGGGGGTYGVVTEVIVKAFPSPQTTSHTFKVGSLSPNTSTEYYQLLGFLHAEMQRLKEGGLQGYYFAVGPPVAPTLSFLWTFVAFNKPNGTIQNLMKPIESYLNARSNLFVYTQEFTYANSYFDIYGQQTNEDVAQGGSAYGSWLLSPKSLKDANLTARVFAKIGPSADASKPNAPVAGPILLGHMIAPPDTPPYYPQISSVNPAWRNTISHFIIVESWQDGMPRALIDTTYQDITKNKVQALRELSPETGAYFNEPDSYEPEWQKAFFGDNYGHLLGVKRKYDPKNVLWCRRCVGSEALVEKGDGRLCHA